jgi:signal transduction histidine kinase
LVALGYTVYKYLRQKQAAALNEQMLHELQTAITVKEEERARIAAELHDEIGSTLSGVSLYTSLALQQMENNKQDQSKNSLFKISSNVQETLSRLKDIVWELRPHTETMQSIQQRIKIYCTEITKPAGINAHFSFNTNGEQKQFDQEILKHVYLISKEAVNNAVKYAGCNNIYVSIAVNDALWMQVKDDGKGFDDSVMFEGNGLRNIKKRASDMRAQLTINSSAEGTIVSLIKGV